MKIRESTLLEYRRFDTPDFTGERSRKGLEQFHVRESTGKIPVDPDPYYISLCNEKAWWEWTLNFLAEGLFTDRWPGWEMYRQDFKDDPSGLEQLRQRIRQVAKNKLKLSAAGLALLDQCLTKPAKLPHQPAKLPHQPIKYLQPPN